MGKFYVEVKAVAQVFAPLPVEAETVEEAKQKALEMVAKNSCEVRWIQTGVAGNSLEVETAEYMGDGDPTEFMRRVMTKTINSTPTDRKTLEESYGKVWDTQELQEDFVVHGFLAPFCHVTRKSDGKQGSLTFQHAPRFYWGFEEANDGKGT